jgi:hypothetical protein
MVLFQKNEKRREGIVRLERRKRDVLRDVVNLPCAGKHVCSDRSVGGAVWSWGFPLVPASNFISFSQAY